MQNLLICENLMVIGTFFSISRCRKKENGEIKIQNLGKEKCQENEKKKHSEIIRPILARMLKLKMEGLGALTVRADNANILS